MLGVEQLLLQHPVPDRGVAAGARLLQSATTPFRTSTSTWFRSLRLVSWVCRSVKQIDGVIGLRLPVAERLLIEDAGDLGRKIAPENLAERGADAALEIVWPLSTEPIRT